VFHIAFGKTVPEISLNAVANLGYAECRFVRPCFVGDTLSVTSNVVGLKENSNGKTGIVYVHSVATNQNQNTVLEWKRWVMVHKRTASAPLSLNSQPDLKPFVDAQQLVIPEQLHFNNFDIRWSASPHLWDDYQPGEIINHCDGITINDSDHSLATRLYQNNAKVHFDGFAMKTSRHQQRLVYGGHIISLCRAISHNGLANGLWLAAINGGSHINPSFSGDTIYCQSRVIDKGAFDQRDDLGWIRVVSYGFKNCEDQLQTSLLATQPIAKDNPHLVLELDYTLLMPRR
jgi:2-methylfumaryl-CoA hydratase